MANGESKQQRIHIDFVKINEIAQRGIRRAAVFMGLGVNAADSEALKEHRLVNDTRIEILPSTVSPEVLKEWKGEFRLWVVSCGFRELVDSLCTYVDAVNHVCHLMNRTLTAEGQEKFERLGLDKKLDALHSDLGVTALHRSQIASFYPVRNCFAHRLGRVGQADIKNGEKLTLKYLRMALVSQLKDKTILPLPDLFVPTTGAFTIQPGQETIALQFKEESLAFGAGEVIRLSPRQLTDILLFSDMFLKNLNGEAIKFLRSKGVRNADEVATDPKDVSAPAEDMNPT